MRVRHERLDEEIPQSALNVLDLLDLVCACCNPLLRLCPSSIELKKSGLASSLDQLIWLCDELGALLEEEWVFGLSSVQNTVDIVAIGKSYCGKFGWWVVR